MTSYLPLFSFVWTQGSEYKFDCLNGLPNIYLYYFVHLLGKLSKKITTKHMEIFQMLSRKILNAQKAILLVVC